MARKYTVELTPLELLAASEAIHNYTRPGAGWMQGAQSRVARKIRKQLYAAQTHDQDFAERVRKGNG